VPKGRLTRPATDRVRESMFNIISARHSMAGIDVLDLFCGTGALGLEAISRGARHATFVELSREVLRVARQNAASLDVEDQCTFLQRDALRVATKLSERYDLVFADPPYHLEGIDSLPELVVPQLKTNGMFFLEHDRRLSFENVATFVERRTYGRTIVSIFGPIEEGL